MARMALPCSCGARTPVKTFIILGGWRPDTTCKPRARHPRPALTTPVALSEAAASVRPMEIPSDRAQELYWQLTDDSGRHQCPYEMLRAWLALTAGDPAVVTYASMNNSEGTQWTVLGVRKKSLVVLRATSSASEWHADATDAGSRIDTAARLPIDAVVRVELLNSSDVNRPNQSFTLRNQWRVSLMDGSDFLVPLHSPDRAGATAADGFISALTEARFGAADPT